MIYRILHRKLTETDWNSKVEGNPGYLYEKLGNFVFLDVSDYTIYSRIENKNSKIKYVDIFDVSKLGDRYIKINTKRRLNQLLLKCNSKDIFVFQSESNIRTRLVLKELNKLGLNSLVLNHWQVPMLSLLNLPEHEKKNFDYFLKNKNILFQKFLYKMYDETIPANLYFDYAFCSGEVNKDLLLKNVNVNKILKCHSVAYDEFIESSKKSDDDLSSGEYMVFVDQALTIHPDGSRNFSEEGKKYYDEMIIKSLEEIQKRENCKIIISQHPRCQYGKDFWRNFEVSTGKTVSLIKHSKKVIGHYSTSLYLSVFFNKEVILIESSNKLFPYSHFVEATHKITGGRLFDMEENDYTKDAVMTGSIQKYFSFSPDIKLLNREMFFNFLNFYN